ncbi:hypothetical protein VC87395_002036 [Vibrio paracholerae 87395]|nr:hypothetical protein VCCP1035_1769 [Vibrio cholerae CP1035(8)]EMP92593.1 hypothetical protein VC87395_002036 [Vibrio paracholerae 87395]EMQ68566.1 hypothetical protein VCNHCC008D_001558 [Vibrio cholerae O1 str. NHCC-008D]
MAEMIHKENPSSANGLTHPKSPKGNNFITFNIFKINATKTLALILQNLNTTH